MYFLAPTLALQCDASGRDIVVVSKAWVMMRHKKKFKQWNFNLGGNSHAKFKLWLYVKQIWSTEQWCVSFLFVRFLFTLSRYKCFYSICSVNIYFSISTMLVVNIIVYVLRQSWFPIMSLFKTSVWESPPTIYWKASLNSHIYIQYIYIYI